MDWICLLQAIGCFLVSVLLMAGALGLIYLVISGIGWVLEKMGLDSDQIGGWALVVFAVLLIGVWSASLVYKIYQVIC